MFCRHEGGLFMRWHDKPIQQLSGWVGGGRWGCKISFGSRGQLLKKLKAVLDSENG